MYTPACLTYGVGGVLACLLASHCYAAPNPSRQCLQGHKISHTFTSGAAWDFCASFPTQEGLEISQAHYTPPAQTRRRVLGQASLSQLETIFDDNRSRPLFLVTQVGLGGEHLLNLTPNDCPDGILYTQRDERPVLCTRSQTFGYQYKYEQSYQGHFFEVFAISQPDTRTYTLRWRFYENGIIEPALGMSGKLPKLEAENTQAGRIVTASGTWGSSFTDYAGWRLDFDLGQSPTNDIIEEITSTPTPSRRQKETAITPITQEIGRKLDPETKRFWRVRDSNETNANGRPISYEIVPSQYHHSTTNVRGRLWLNEDIYFTEYKACERHASNNPVESGCPTSNVKDFTGNQTYINSSDIVVWYKQNRHYLPRSEDGALIGMTWISFQLLPRDWQASNPF